MRAQGQAGTRGFSCHEKLSLHLHTPDRTLPLTAFTSLRGPQFARSSRCVAAPPLDAFQALAPERGGRPDPKSGVAAGREAGKLDCCGQAEAVGWWCWLALTDLSRLHTPWTASRGQQPLVPFFPQLGVGCGGVSHWTLVTQDKVALLAKDLENMGPSFSRLLLACSGEGFSRTFG